MGTIKTKGIVLAEHNMGDYDKMITLLTPGLGKISCAAKGARRPKSSLLAQVHNIYVLENTFYIKGQIHII